MDSRDQGFFDPPLAIELATFGLLGGLFLIAVVTPPRGGEGTGIPLQIASAALAYGLARHVATRLGRGFPPVALHGAALLVVYSFLFKTTVRLQGSLVTEPNDQLLIAADRAIFGSEASVWMQQFVSPALTEWMMFSYVIYVPMLPLLALVCWKRGGESGAYDFLLNFALANVLCYTGFLLFPVETPMYHHPEEFVRPLEGGLFAWCGEWIRANAHAQGGGLPSPHCAVATVMLAMVHRYARRAFPVLLPIVVTLYVSTVYCRYHYLWDAVAGVLAGVLVLRASPRLSAAGQRLRAPARVMQCVPQLRREEGGKEEVP